MSSGALQVSHVIAGLDAAYGGPSYTVPRLCRALAAAGAEVALLSIASATAAPQDAYLDGYRDRRFACSYAGVPILRDLRWSSGLRAELRRTAHNADVIHDHGLWLMPNVEAAWCAAQAQKPLLVSPRGMFAPAALAFSRWKKRAFWQLLQGAAVRRAACVHATSEQEYQEIRDFGLRNPVAIIPNGVDLPELPGAAINTSRPDHVVLSLGRLHPKKALDVLIRAWARVEAAHPGWHLKVVGPSEAGYDAKLEALAATLRLRRVSIEGPVSAEAKLSEYRKADLFVLTSLNENFGMTAAEALAAGTPVIATKGAPWGGLEAEGCGWWVEHGVEPLASALAKAMEMPNEALRIMGARGRAWMARDYSWNRVADEMLRVYRWLALGAESPPMVRFN
jgi:glycosyltransferase involved in cell wall biosynthesis